MTREEVLQVLVSGDFDAFVGEPETLHVEFKGEPYQLDRDSQRFELAKDASALANAEGGIIVIGARTERGQDVPADVVSRIRRIDQGLIDEQRYEDIITERVYPGLRGLSVRFWGSASDASRGLIAIDVPPQEEVDKYFLVSRPIEEGVDRTPGWLVGVAVRTVGRVEERRIGEIHTLINRGLFVGGQLSDVTEGIAELSAGLAEMKMLVAGAPVNLVESPADGLQAAIEERLAEVEREDG